MVPVDRTVMALFYFSGNYMNLASNTIKLLLVGMASLTLTACGGEPSQGDIDAAIKKEQLAMPKLMEGLVPVVKNVKKIGCKADGEKAYICDVELEVEQLGKTNKGMTPEHFAALKAVGEAINAYRRADRAIVLITHFQRLLDLVKPDRVHVLTDGRIQQSGDVDLAGKLERDGYDWIVRG